jgi:glutamate N-acetyltransferase/amino-acid N-acetyltransferase
MKKSPAKPAPKSAAAAPAPKAILPAGFRAAGTAAGLKPSGAPDMAMFFSDTPAVLAATFTTNQVRAATVKLDAQRLAEIGAAHGIVVNSGQANACTGPRGMKDARDMAALAAAATGVAPEMFLVCSTGRIGVPLRMDLISGGIRTLAGALSPKGGEDAARAIMTTDTRPKRWTATFDASGVRCRLTGIAKGSGMIAPHMATMLAFLMTDAAIDRRAMQKALSAAVADSFNKISVDGDQSTNDTVLFLANGRAGNTPLRPGQPGWDSFLAALSAVTSRLAEDMARDGEGASKLVRLELAGAKTAVDAEAAVRSVGESLLVKTSWVGTYPNWGRIMDALGYSAARVDETRVDIAYDGIPAVRRGVATGVAQEKLSAVLAKKEFTISIHLHLGRATARLLTCDCTKDYVDINCD